MTHLCAMKRHLERTRVRAQGCWLRQVNAGDIDDGLPRGFLVGAIVKVRVALHQWNHQPLHGRASVSHRLGVGCAAGRHGVYGRCRGGAGIHAGEKPRVF